MRRLAWLLPLAFFFLNPAFACDSGDGPTYHFGALEMRAAVEGAWSFSIVPYGGGAVQKVSVKIEQSSGAPDAGTQARASTRRSLIRAAYACGGRTLVRSAGACLDITTMPLTVSILSSDPPLAGAPPTGSFWVSGYDFFSGMLELHLGAYVLEVEVLEDGTVGNANVMTTDGAAGTLPLVTRG